MKWRVRVLTFVLFLSHIWATRRFSDSVLVQQGVYGLILVISRDLRSNSGNRGKFNPHPEFVTVT